MSEFGPNIDVPMTANLKNGETAKGERFKMTLDAAVVATMAVVNVLPDRFGLSENVWRHALDIAIKPVKHSARDILEKDKPEYITNIEANPHLRPYSEIIAEGIEMYRQTHGKDPTYTFKPDRIGIRDFLRMMGQKMTLEDEQEFCKPGGHSNFKKIPMAGRSVIASMMSGVLAGLSYTGVREMMEMKLPPPLTKIITNAEADHGAPMEVSNQTVNEFYGKLLFLDVKIEDHVKKTGSPVSASFILSELLKQHDGDLNLALFNLAEFLKYKARHNVNNSTSPPENKRWIPDHVVDEYSDFVPYPQLNDVEYELDDKRMNNRGKKALLTVSKVFGNRYIQKYVNFDYSLLNQIGKPYHAAHMVALLESFPPEMIAMMTSMEYLLHGVNQGMSKFLSDLRVLRDLKTTENVLKQYSTNAPPSTI